MGKKVQSQQKKIVQNFSLYIVSPCIDFAFKFFETREKMTADHDLVVFGQSACRAQFETLKAKLGP